MAAWDTGHTAARGLGVAFFGAEIVQIISDMRWALALLVVLIIADFRYGSSENGRRYKAAKHAGNEVVALKYKWRTSKAVRRTCNKFLDYFLLMAVGAAFGMALLEPVGVPHTFGAYGAAAIAFFCESKSIVGYFFFLRGVQIEERSISGFLKAFAVAILKKENQKMGDALEEALGNTTKKDNGD